MGKYDKYLTKIVISAPSRENAMECLLQIYERLKEDMKHDYPFEPHTKYTYNYFNVCEMKKEGDDVHS